MEDKIFTGEIIEYIVDKPVGHVLYKFTWINYITSWQPVDGKYEEVLSI